MEENTKAEQNKQGIYSGTEKKWGDFFSRTDRHVVEIVNRESTGNYTNEM